MSETVSPNLTIKEFFLKACAKGNLGLGRILLANGSDVNWVDGGLWSGLHLAARGGDGDLLDLLLAQPGVEVNLKSSRNETPLMVACVYGYENIVRKLLQVEGIELNCQDVGGDTALHNAVLEGWPGCIRVLREAPGLDWNLKDGDGMTPLLSAAFLGAADCLQMLLRVPHVDLTATHCGYNVVWLTVRNLGRDSLRCVELLAEKPNVDWNTRDKTGDTPLLFCLKQKKLDMSKLLLSNPRVDLDVQDSAGKFPETIARELGLREILDLMWSGARLNDKMSECPVCYVKFSRTSVVNHCQQGHFVCGDCQPRVQFCPTCRGRMIGRAHGFEDHLQRLQV